MRNEIHGWRFGFMMHFMKRLGSWCWGLVIEGGFLWGMVFRDGSWKKLMLR